MTRERRALVVDREPFLVDLARFGCHANASARERRAIHRVSRDQQRDFQ
jgi:hypothetical protein